MNKDKTEKWIVRMSLVLLLIGLPSEGSAKNKKAQAKIVAEEITTIANQLSHQPERAIDFSEVSGEYCFDVDIAEGGHMTHYAIDPTKTQEDVIDFVNAEPLIRAGVNVDKLPKFPGELGKMEPNQWYYLPAGEIEPHHGMRFPFPLMIRASDLE